MCSIHYIHYIRKLTCVIVTVSQTPPMIGVGSGEGNPRIGSAPMLSVVVFVVCATRAPKGAGGFCVMLLL